MCTRYLYSHPLQHVHKVSILTSLTACAQGIYTHIPYSMCTRYLYSYPLQYVHKVSILTSLTVCAQGIYTHIPYSMCTRYLYSHPLQHVHKVSILTSLTACAQGISEPLIECVIAILACITLILVGRVSIYPTHCTYYQQ